MMIKRTTFFFLLLVLFFAKSFGQGVVCPSNIDFENGNLSNWTCYIGNTYDAGGINFISVTNSGGPIAGRHVITSAASGNDRYGNFPMLCPTGGGYSIKLGNDNVGDSAERVRYKIRIPSSNSFYSVLYSYAVVLDDGTNSGTPHQSYQQPRFNVEAFDSATNLPISCLPQPFVATSSLPGFSLSNTPDGYLDYSVWYQPWVTRTLNLSGLAGKTVYLQFTTADCTLGGCSSCGHFGYAYVDVQCGVFQITNGYCPGASTVPLSAPPGYQSYAWHDSLYHSLGTTQNITITAPALPKKITVILTPYTGYGCKDSLTTYITPLPKPVANFIRPDTFCAKSTLQFIDSSYSKTIGTYINNWQWNFGDVGSGSNNTSTSQNPTHTYQSSGHYTVSLIVKSNISCVSDTAKKTIYIKPNIAVNAGVDTTVCYNTKALLHGTVTPIVASTGSYSYSWSPSIGLNCATCKNTTTPNLTTTTTYYFTTNYFPNGCSQTDTIVVNVASPSLTIAAQASPTTTCANSQVQLTTNSYPVICGSYNGSCANSSTNLIGTGTGAATATYPYLQYYEDGRTQLLFLKSELNAAGINGGVINSLALRVKTKNSTKQFTNFNIKIGCTALTSLSNWQTGLTNVFSANISTTANSWNTYNFTNDYSWDGVSNLIVEICYDNTSGNWSFYDNVWATNTAFNSVLYYEDDGVHGCTMASLYAPTTLRPDVKFGICLPPSTGMTYSWIPSAPLNNANISNPTATILTTTTFTVTASSGTCNSSSASVTVVVNNLQANFNSKDTICLGSSIAFTNSSVATSVDSIKHYYWNFGDVGSGAANISHLKNPTHLFSTTGTFTVTLVDTSISGCISLPFTKTIVVIAPFLVDAGLNDSVCVNGSKPLLAVVSPSGSYTYSWSPSATLSCNNCSNPTATPTSSTFYTITVSAAGCSAKDSVQIKVNPSSPIPTATATPATICSGGTSQLLATIPSPTCGAAASACSIGTSYVVGNGVSTIYYPFVGFYSDARTQLLYLKSELNTAGITGGTIRELALYVASKGSTQPYNNFTIKIGCTALTNLSASWQTGLTTVFTTGSGISTVAGAWNNFVLNTPYSWDGASNLIVEICYDNASATNYDFVNYTNTAFTSVSYNYLNSGSGCSMAANLISTLRPNIRFNICLVATNVNYSWTPTSGLSNSLIANPVATPNNTTTYTVSVVSGNCPANTANVVVTVPTMIVNAGRDTSICAGNSVQLNATAMGTNSPFTFSWNPTTSLNNATIANPVATPTVTTTYIVTATGANSCIKNDTVVITVNSNFSVSTSATNILCHGLTTGVATANAVGTGNFSYSWNTIPIQHTASITNLAAGIYTVTVSKGSCSISKNDTITQPSALANSSRGCGLKSLEFRSG